MILSARGKVKMTAISILDQMRQRISAHQPRPLRMNLPQAGVLVPVTDREEGPEIILTKRSDRLRTHRGQVAFPGGRRDREDDSLLVTALRESQEEIALDPAKVELVGELDQVVSRFGILVTPYVGIVPAEVELRANPEELDSVFKVPLDFFLRDERKRTDLIPFQDMVLHVPCWQFQQYEIWGLSAIILANFMNVAFEAGINLIQRANGSSKP